MPNLPNMAIYFLEVCHNIFAIFTIVAKNIYFCFPQPFSNFTIIIMLYSTLPAFFLYIAIWYCYIYIVYILLYLPADFFPFILPAPGFLPSFGLSSICIIKKRVPFYGYSLFFLSSCQIFYMFSLFCAILF